MVEHCHPFVEAEVLVPVVKSTAGPPRGLDHACEATVAPGENAFEEASLGSVELQRHGAIAHSGAQPALDFQHTLQGDHGLPLERRMGLGHKWGDGHVDLSPSAKGLACLGHSLGDVHDPVQVLVGLGGQPDHEVELDQPPALSERLLAAAEQVSLLDVLVDDRAQAVSRGLRRYGERAFAHVLQQRGQGGELVVHPQGRQCHVHVMWGKFLLHPLDELGQVGVVAAGQRVQRDLVVASVCVGLLCQLEQPIRGPRPCRALGHAGLAEPTALCASAEDLDANAVVHCLDVGHDGVCGEVGRVKVVNPRGHHRHARGLGARPNI